MTRDDIIQMAREAGCDPHDMSDDFSCNLRDLERFAALVAAHEREACAWVVINADSDFRAMKRIAAQIRARGDKS
jgi:hypothetical protein